MIKIFESDFDNKELNAAKAVIKSGWLTNGEVTKNFEKKIESIFLKKRANVTAVSSCTAALHLALIDSKIGRGDEVIVPALTFVSDFNVVKAVGAKPILCDVSSFKEWSPSLKDIKKVVTKKTKACILVHFAGIPCKDIFKIKKFCETKKIILIEDVAHAPGASISGEPCGSIGDYGTFSFYSNKNFSTGEGGAISSKKNSKVLKRIRSHGMTSSTLDREKGRVFSYDVSEIGLNYRIDEIRAALGIEQINKFKIKNKKRRDILLAYLDDLPDKIITPHKYAVESKIINSVDHIMPILLPSESNKEKVINSLKKQNIQTTMHYPAPWRFSAYKKEFLKSMNPVTDEITAREITLPLHTLMTQKDARKVCFELKKVI